MGQRGQKTVLFLCTGNYYRSRFAEVVFNHVAGKFGLPWHAASRGLALERGSRNVGPMAVPALEALAARGITAAEACARFPVQATVEELQQADLVIALKQAEHEPLLRERYPACAGRVECWHIDDEPAALAEVEREVMDLIARLMGGGKAAPAPPPAPAAAPAPPPRPAATVRVGRETKGRRGKGVTTVSDLPLDAAGLAELCTRLKDRCGTGGTVKDGRVEIQGDQRDRVAAELEKLGYKVKRSGG